jgi:hypothetical protein
MQQGCKQTVSITSCMLAAHGAAAHPPEEDWRSSADILPLGSNPPLLPLLLPSRPNLPAATGPASEPDDALLLLVLLHSPPSAAAARMAVAAADALLPAAPCSALPIPAVLALLLTPSMGVSRSTGPAALLVAAGASKDSDLELGCEAELCCVLLDELVMRPSTTGPAGQQQVAYANSGAAHCSVRTSGPLLSKRHVYACASTFV